MATGELATATRWWHREGEQIVCDLCPRECRLHAGQRGFCFVRQNVDQEMRLTTYGRSSGFCIDPIEKKPLNHFQPGTPVLSFGTAGCNLGCKFCQNWSISKAREIETLSDNASPEQIARAAKDSGCRSVAFTYNDPVIWAEYAIDTAHACHALGLKTVAVTAGYISPAARSDFYAVMDAANVDLKAFTPEFYKHLTLSKLEPVLETLRWLKHESNVWFEITNLMIPGENDSPDETARMCDWIVEHLGVDVPVHFTAFHPDFRMQDHPPTPPETLRRARSQALQAGIRHAYVGNTHDVAGQSTYCPGCRTLLIERDWYVLGAYRLQGNRCANCGTQIAGVYDERPGDWGNKRVPLRISQPVVQISSPKVAAAPAETRTAMPQLPVVDFPEAEADRLLAYLRAATEARLFGGSIPELPADLAALPTYGIFITFRRAAALRFCRGRFGEVKPLGDLLNYLIHEAFPQDPRFPAITADELVRLHIEASLMFNPKVMSARGEQRIAAVEVGRHGLVINHPQGTGLLLPQVATESGWDATTFLSAICAKAGLPQDSWLDDASLLMTFEARVIEAPPPLREFDARQLSVELLDRLAEIGENVLREDSLDAAGLPDALTALQNTDFGLILQTVSGRSTVTLAPRQSLAEMASSAARSLRYGIPKNARPFERVQQIALLWQPIALQPADYPDRHQSLGNAAVVARRRDQWGVHIAPPEQTANAVAGALQSVGSSIADWQQAASGVSVTAYSVYARRRDQEDRATATDAGLRPAAMAGRFYPANPVEMSAAVENYLSEGRGTPETMRAVLLPHAGWTFCGSVIGRTLARVQVPRTVILIGPSHTGAGANWSVSAASTWEIPGAQIPIAAELRTRLLDLVPLLTCENDAHRQEHALEVLLPFLHRRNPDLQVLPIILGPTSYSQTEQLSRALAILVAESAEPPLLVISSDLNHFATELENRRLDLLAVEALESGDPNRVFDTVQGHNISMCGVIPAVVVLRALHHTGTAPQPQLVHYTNSGQVTGDHSRVVGYAGMLLR